MPSLLPYCSGRVVGLLKATFCYHHFFLGNYLRRVCSRPQKSHTTGIVCQANVLVLHMQRVLKAMPSIILFLGRLS
ncbi:hypothetical protein DUNSADRAFT_17374 [Dunaliella salina]|uniref:Encoded protein n=1 Tax=Dunaliella salina TaxID=3046 RepID=A0ABQ7H0B3_DUNSA|nr:hypothetical protein DUNSADRAFT_17374 [Dunaliella salina]|eukprot:KAF5840271.1 hypothetical protein DUNSADRAFT_17374 [Dunaliella salina]